MGSAKPWRRASLRALRPLFLYAARARRAASRGEKEKCPAWVALVRSAAAGVEREEVKGAAEAAWRARAEERQVERTAGEVGGALKVGEKAAGGGRGRTAATSVGALSKS